MLVSYVIPVYNTKPKWIQECLDSFTGLNFNYEIILVNDGSTNQQTIDFLASVNQHYQIHHIKNGGPSKARNYGIQKAKGTYIFPIDSDDVLVAKSQNKAVQILQKNPKIDVLFANIEYFGNVNKTDFVGEFNLGRLFFSKATYIAISTFFKKSAWVEVNGYDERLQKGEDRDFYTKLGLAGYHFQYLNTSLFKYRKLIDGNSQSQRHDYREFEKIRQNNIPIEAVTIDLLNDYAVKSMKNNKKLLIKANLICLFPSIFEWLRKKGFFESDYILD